MGITLGTIVYLWIHISETLLNGGLSERVITQ